MAIQFVTLHSPFIVQDMEVSCELLADQGDFVFVSMPSDRPVFLSHYIIISKLFSDFVPYFFGTESPSKGQISETPRFGN